MTDRLTIYQGDALQTLGQLPDESVQTCVTSPPYFGLRDYGHDRQIGLEPTPAEYVAALVKVFQQVRRVLRDDGTLWLNLGDSYGAFGGNTYAGFNERWSGTGGAGSKQDATLSGVTTHKADTGLRPKNLLGIPWRVAFALQDDGWYLRQDIIWCLSGGVRVYAKTQKGEMPTTIKDLARLDPSTVKLWNGEKWTQLLGISKSLRKGDEIELVLRSGERISCTPTHRFPTDRGLVEAGDIRVGDTLTSTTLPEPERVKDCAIDTDAAWFAGLYLAEGSRSGSAIQIAGHTKESERWERVQKIAAKYGGSATQTIDGNSMNIRVYGRILHAIIDELVSGKTAHNKSFSPTVWKYSNAFVEAMVDGYLSGDGSKQGKRWRLGFSRNYNLEASLRTACARLGYSLTLNMTKVAYGDGYNPTFLSELRKTVSDHHNNKSRLEVVKIRKSRARQFYDLGVEDEPHLFALASGVLTHNSKPNPMPESVTDRCTKAHEYLFLLSKSPKYYYDHEAIKEPVESVQPPRRFGRKEYEKAQSENGHEGAREIALSTGQGTDTTSGNHYGRVFGGHETRNKRSVWTVSTKPYKGAHFATFPPNLIKPCILAGAPEGGVVLDPFGGSGTTAEVALQHQRRAILCELNPEYVKLIEQRLAPLLAQPSLFPIPTEEDVLH